VTYYSSTPCLLVAALSLAGCRGWARGGPSEKELAESRRWTYEAAAALADQNCAHAEACGRRAVAACPADCDARRQLAEVLWRQGQIAPAIEQLEEARRYADDPAPLVRLGEMWLAAGRADVAVERADLALDADPSAGGAWALRAAANHKAGRPEEALYDYARALGNRPDDAALMQGMAQLYREIGRPHAALTLIASVSEQYAEGEQPQELADLYGQILFDLARYDDAAQMFATAAARGPASVELLCRLGEARLLAGRPDAARDAAEAALALDPTHGPSVALWQRAELAPRR
jgi:tetratricopeptide (TPR) repeat protein